MIETDEIDKRQDTQLADHIATNSKIEKRCGTIQAMQSSLTLLSDKCDELFKIMQADNGEIKELRKKNDDLEANCRHGIPNCASLRKMLKDWKLIPEETWKFMK